MRNTNRFKNQDIRDVQGLESKHANQSTCKFYMDFSKWLNKTVFYVCILPKYSFFEKEVIKSRKRLKIEENYKVSDLFLYNVQFEN